jgi:hypothetical protein
MTKTISKTQNFTIKFVPLLVAGFVFAFSFMAFSPKAHAQMFIRDDFDMTMFTGGGYSYSGHSNLIPGSLGVYPTFHFIGSSNYPTFTFVPQPPYPPHFGGGYGMGSGMGGYNGMGGYGMGMGGYGMSGYGMGMGGYNGMGMGGYGMGRSPYQSPTAPFFVRAAPNGNLMY